MNRKTICPLIKGPCHEDCSWYRETEADEQDYSVCALIHVLEKITNQTIDVFAEVVR